MTYRTIWSFCIPVKKSIQINSILEIFRCFLKPNLELIDWIIISLCSGLFQLSWRRSSRRTSKTCHIFVNNCFIFSLLFSRCVQLTLFSLRFYFDYSRIVSRKVSLEQNFKIYVCIFMKITNKFVYWPYSRFFLYFNLYLYIPNVYADAGREFILTSFDIPNCSFHSFVIQFFFLCSFKCNGSKFYLVKRNFM